MENQNQFDLSVEKVSSKIFDITPIEQSRNAIVRNRGELRDLVEEPLLSACEELYDKNIRTLSTSANEKDIKYGTGHIIIDFDHLSDENQRIGRSLGEVFQMDEINQLVIKVPIVGTSTVAEIKGFAESVAHRFVKQQLSWAPSYTIQEMRKIHGIDPSDETYGVEGFSAEMYYDPDRKLFFLSEEHARKTKK